MNITRNDIKLILEELIDAKSEMREFATSRSGNKLVSEGRKIINSAKKIKDLGDEQTGKMRETLYKISEFVAKTGASLATLNELDEGASSTDYLPTVNELKSLGKAIKTLEGKK